MVNYYEETSPAERDLIERVFADAEDFRVSRRSEREYDLSVTGGTRVMFAEPMDHVVRFSAWLPLATIRETNWTRYAQMSDYPVMVEHGDWSGIRDSDAETVWRIFEVARRELMERPADRARETVARGIGCATCAQVPPERIVNVRHDGHVTVHGSTGLSVACSVAGGYGLR